MSAIPSRFAPKCPPRAPCGPHREPRSARLAGPRTGRRQPVIDHVVSHGKQTGELFLRIKFAPFKGAKKADMKTARSTHGFPGFKGQTKWLTEAAVRAAMPDFVHWVEFGVNMPQRSGGQGRWSQARERRQLGQHAWPCAAAHALFVVVFWSRLGLDSGPLPDCALWRNGRFLGPPKVDPGWRRG